MISADVTLRTQFYDIDPMNIVWHGNYARYLEESRTNLMTKIGYGYAEMQASGFAWPIVEMWLKYVRPLKLGQKFIMRATLKEYENRIRIEYRGLDAETGDVLTKARTVQLAVSIATGELAFTSPQQLIDCVRSHL
jgi:acyl-CoA thioester hydrolase